MAPLPLLFLALHGSAAQPAERPMTVREVMERAEALDGREIVVSGWVEECRRLSCPLFQSRREARREWPRYWLSVGSSPWFESFARRNVPGRMTLRARLDARCVTDPRTEVIALCSDRAGSLHPLAIVR